MATIWNSDLNKLSPEQRETIERALATYQRQRDYTKKYYYRTKHGVDLDEIKSSVVDQRAVGPPHDQIILREAKHFGRISGEVYFNDGVGIAGEPGWYMGPFPTSSRKTRGVPMPSHVQYATELFTTDWNREDYLWRFAKPGKLVEQPSMMETVRYRMQLALEVLFDRNFIEMDLATTTVASLLNLYLSERTSKYAVRRSSVDFLGRSFRLYLESINLLEAHVPNDLTLTVQEVLDNGRSYIAKYLANQREIDQRALWFRDRIAQEFNFQYDSEGQLFRAGPVTITLEGQVHIGGKYACVVPRIHDNFPKDDIIAAKMVALATTERFKISTLRPHLAILDKQFDGGRNGQNS